MNSRQRQSGAVSIFIVVFASLFMVVITMSFMQLMLKDQSQATASDLSQSALDSAQVGVEDAKRLLLLQQSCADGTVPSGYVSKCNAVTAAIDSGKCNTVAAIFGNASDKETIVQQTSNDSTLQQAYTCVKVTAAPDYSSQLAVNQSNVIPLSSAAPFDRIRISWFTKDDLAASGSGTTIGYPSSGIDVSLPRVGPLWPLKDPALLRAQFIQTGASFKLTDFDAKQGSESDANTAFLYPAAAGADGTNGFDLALDARRVPGGKPQPVKCTNFANSQYACSVVMKVSPYDGTYDKRNAYLHLSSLYNGGHYKVELLNGAANTPVDFKGVQSVVDSTGRANTMFRRVAVRVELKGNFAYPDAALDLKNNLCKDFSITSNPLDYQANATCDPTRAN